MSWLAWTVGAFLVGAIPFSPLIGRLALSKDIRQYGDHNPGSTNVIRAGGWRWGALAFILDYLKGAVPVGLAWFFGGVTGWQIIPVAVAPVAGHAFSPWLGFRGGKAVAATFGIWSGLTLGYVPTILGLLLLVGYLIAEVDGWAVMFALAGVAVHFAVFPPDPVLWGVWAGNAAILAWKHRADLRQAPGWNPALVRRMRRQM